MKRLSTLLVAALLLLSCAGSAFAVDVQARGYWWIEAIARQNWNLLGNGAATSEDNTLSIEQKMRTAFYFTANENLRGVLDTQIGTNNWGNGLYGIGAGRSASTTGGGANAAGNGNIMLRKAYIEYKIPSTMVNLSVGYQTVTLPAAFGGGSAILDDQVASAVISAPLTDNVSITAGYARPYDSQTYGSTASITGSGSSQDVVFAALPVKLGQHSITPFAAYTNAGYQSVSGAGATSLGGYAGPNSTNSDGLRGYWGGVAYTGVVPNHKIMADFNYGKATYNTTSSGTNGGRSGFLFDVAVDYTGYNMLTPELFFTYSSGESGNSTTSSGKSGRMPVIGLPQNWAIGSFFFGERLELAGFMPNGGYTRATLGYWAAGLSLKDITFVDKLSHTFNVLYAKGTNSKDYLYEAGGNVRNAGYGGFLTEKDHLWEVDFNSRYKIYDELSLLLYLGWVHAAYDKDTWGASTVTNAADIRNYAKSDAYKVGLGLNYFF